MTAKRVKNLRSLLRKSLINNSYAAVSPDGWVTNGHWMIHRGSLILAGAPLNPPEKDRAVLKVWLGLDTEPSELANGTREKMMPEGSLAFALTKVLVENGPTTCRVLTGPEGECAYVNDDYLRLIGLEAGDVLYGKDVLSALGDGTPGEADSFVVMPVRLDVSLTLLPSDNPKKGK